MWLGIFWPIILGQQVVGFRDSAYLYYPLFKWIDAQWAAGSIPLWNPHCNFGMPVVHDGSSSVFYPGKIVFFIRALSYPARYGIYIAIHIPIAAAGTYWFARVLKAKPVGATLAAISFSFSGYVLFQTTNVVYLVSSAWLPFALCSVWLMFRQPKLKWAVGTGIFCALMILGGDPQMCYHVGLVMLAFAIWKFLRTRRRNLKAKVRPGIRPRPYRQAVQSGLLILISVLVSAGLAAIQILPSYVWSQGSIRSESSVPRNIYEVLSPKQGKDHPVYAGLLAKPLENTHHDHIYQFSQPPWTLSEWVWPNISGKPYPTHQRWVDGLPGAERMWTPSIYLGCFTFLLACVAFNPFSRNRRYAWLSRIAMFFAIASFGWYGPVWLVNELAPKLLENQNVGAPVGGLYWVMVVLLPKYASFRYPAKLIVLSILALSVLAGLDRGQANQRLRKMFILILLAVLGSAGIYLLNQQIAGAGGRTASELFGPFKVDQCQQALQTSAFFAIVLLVVGSVVYWLRLRWSAILILAICSFDLLLMNSWLVPKVESETFEAANQWTSWVDDKNAPAIYRNIPNFGSARGIPFPDKWKRHSSEQRLDEIVEWQRASLHAKHHLQFGIQSLDSFYSVEPVLKPHKRFILLSNSYLLGQHRSGEIFPIPLGTTSNSIIFFENRFQRIQYSWHSCNKVVIELMISNNPDTSDEFAVNLQPVSGWVYSAVKKDTNEIVVDKRPIEPVDNEMRISLPPDRPLVVTAEYSPLEFRAGAWISGISWMALILCGVWILCFKKPGSRRKRAQSASE